MVKLMVVVVVSMVVVVKKVGAFTLFFIKLGLGSNRGIY